MFARKVSMRLKDDAAGPFIQKIEDEIIPLLRKRKGFLHELTLIPHGGREVHSYSFWECNQDAETSDCTAFSEVRNLLSGLIAGPVRVNTYMVANSTFHKIAAAVAS